MEDTTLSIQSKEEYLSKVEEVREAAKVYELTPDMPLMDDFTYDMLLRQLQAAEKENPSWKQGVSVTESVGAGVNLGGDIIHSAPMLSLDNVFNEDELREWEAKLTRALGRPAVSYVIEPKLDGLALSARYVDGKLSMLLLRGSGRAGEDVSHNARLIAGLPQQLNQKLTVEIRGECFLSNEDFAKANVLRVENGDEPFVNPRNGAAGTIRAKNRTYDIPLSFLAYGVIGYDHLHYSAAMEMVQRLGVKTAKDSSAGMLQASNADEIIAAIKTLGEKRDELEFEIDGAVVKADNPQDRDEAGFTSRAPRWAIAWKYPPVTRLTVLKEISLQLGRTGAVTPVAILEPVVVSGSTISNVTLHNSSEIARKDLREGDSVWVRKAGDVIPEILGVKLADRKEDSLPWEPPKTCPRCGGELNTSQKVWRCLQGRKCGLAEAVYYYTSKKCLDIDSVGKTLSKLLVEKGLVQDVADLYSLKAEQLVELERMGSLRAEKAIEEIEKSKRQPLSRVFAGLGIRLTGERMSRTLANHFGSMDAIREASVEQMASVDGVGSVRAASILSELSELSDVIDRLSAAGVNMTEPGFGQELSGNLVFRKEDGTPKSVVVTGTVTGLSRSEVQEAVIKMGGRPASSVSSKTDLVVVGENAGSKEVKAKALGLPIMSAEEFVKLLNA